MLPYLLTGVLKNILSPDSSGAQLKINAPLYHSDVVDLGGAWESNHKELVKFFCGTSIKVHNIYSLIVRSRRLLGKLFIVLK